MRRYGPRGPIRPSGPSGPHWVPRPPCSLAQRLGVRANIHTLQDILQQAQIDRFIAYYNEERPHGALARRTPAEAYAARIKAEPQGNGHPPARHYRVRHDRVDAGGTVTLRYRSRLRHIAVGRANKGRRLVLLVADRDVRVLSTEGEILRQLLLDPSRKYQPLA